MDDIKAGLQYVFQTNNRLTLAISASGHSGMEACLANLLEPTDTILIIKAGLWGERAEEMSKRLGAHVSSIINYIYLFRNLKKNNCLINQQVETLTIPLGSAVTHQQFESAMKKFKPAVVFLTHSESSTGLKQPLIGFGDIVRRFFFFIIIHTY